MKRIRVSAPAERDLDEIWLHVAQRAGSLEIANGIIDSITEVFLLLGSAPEAGASREEIEPGLRGFPTGNYIVYYRRAGSYIVISRVIHGMREQRNAFRND